MWTLRLETIPKTNQQPLTLIKRKIDRQNNNKQLPAVFAAIPLVSVILVAISLHRKKEKKVEKLAFLLLRLGEKCRSFFSGSGNVRGVVMLRCYKYASS